MFVHLSDIARKYRVPLPVSQGQLAALMEQALVETGKQRCFTQASICCEACLFWTGVFCQKKRFARRGCFEWFEPAADVVVVTYRRGEVML